MMHPVGNRPAAPMRFQATYHSEMVRGEFNHGVRPIRDRGEGINHQQPGRKDLQMDGENAVPFGVPEEDDSYQGYMQHINTYQAERLSMTINQPSDESATTTQASRDVVETPRPDQ